MSSSSPSRAPWVEFPRRRDALDDQAEAAQADAGTGLDRDSANGNVVLDAAADADAAKSGSGRLDPSLPPDVAKRLAMAESRANKAERLAQNNADKLMSMIERIKSMAEARKIAQRPSQQIISGEARADEFRVPLPKRYQRSSGIEVVPSAYVRKRRSKTGFALLWFVLVAVLPVALAGIYYYQYATDQFASGSQFFVRGGEASSSDTFGKLTGLAKAGGISTFVDAQIVAEYLKSRQIVEDLLPVVDLRQAYTRPEADWYARLKDDASIEELTDYWNSMVTVTAELTSGIVTFEVHAFTADDAAKIAQAALAASEKLVNDLSLRARNDAVRSATTDVEKAETKLKEARIKLRELRDSEQVLDARGVVEANTRLVAELEANLAKLNADLTDRLRYLSPTAPTITALRNSIESLKIEIARVKASVVAQSGDAGIAVVPEGAPKPLTSVLTDFEESYTEVQVDEAFYKGALEYLQHARAQADRQQSYLSVIVKPAKADIATYPQRERAIITVALVSVIAWVLSVLIAHSVRDHML